MTEKNDLFERVNSVWEKMTGRMRAPEEQNGQNNAVSRQQIGVGAVGNPTDAIYKATIPQFFFKPPYGLPLFKDAPEIRRLAGTPYVSMIRNTICNEIAALDWDVVVEEGDNVPDEIVKKTKDFLYNINRNPEPLPQLLTKFIGDSVEGDWAVLEKVRNMKGDLVEIYARDGALFTKNPDIHGIMPEFGAYWQYSWNSGLDPVPFALNEIVYATRNARTDSEYGRGEVENLADTLQLLLYGIDSNLEYYSDNQTAKGIISMAGANGDDVRAFQDNMREAMRKRDPAGKWRKYFYKTPAVNTKVEFIQTGLSNLELEQLEQQKWFIKIVWACFGINSNELGFTDDINKANGAMQSAAIKRKLLKPYMNLIETKFDQEIINDLPWVKGRFEDKLHFEFDRTDLGMEMAERQVVWGDYNAGLITLNEAREALHMLPTPGGDAVKSFGGGFGGASSPSAGAVSSPKEDTAGLIDKEKEKPEVATEEKAFKKKVCTTVDYEVKSLSSASPLNPKAFEEIQTLSDFRKQTRELYAQQLDSLLAGLSVESVEQKSLDDVINRVLGAFKMGTLSLLGLQVAKTGYSQGLDEAGKQLNQNFVPNTQAADFLEKYTFELVQGLNEETANDLRAELRRGILSKDSRDVLAKRIKDVLDVSQTRAETIAVTEMNRAQNMGALQGYKDSGLKGQVEWSAVHSGNLDEVCARLDGQQVGLNGVFEDKPTQWKGFPPQHPNCRCRVVFDTE